jgi:putative component of toxin-antitoxin plasmid stabilization module
MMKYEIETTLEFDRWLKKIRDKIVLLLCGGDKSTQSKDIAKAKRLLSQLR